MVAPSRQRRLTRREMVAAMSDDDPRCSCGQLRSQHVGPDGACICCRCPGFTDDWTPVESLICENWRLMLPPYRAYRWSRAWHEAARLCAMHSVIQPDDVVYEVGAEEGDYGALFTSWGAQVVIAEPNPFCWPSIKASFEANGTRPVAWWQGFLANRPWLAEGEKNLLDRFGRDGWPEAANGELIPEHGFQHIAEHGEVTSAMTLDQLAARVAQPPDVISIDVEGGELHVLRGAALTLAAHHAVVFVSIHPAFLNDLYGLDAQEVYDYMAEHGYAPTHLATDHEVHVAFTHPEGRQL